MIEHERIVIAAGAPLGLAPVGGAAPAVGVVGYRVYRATADNFQRSGDPGRVAGGTK